MSDDFMGYCEFTITTQDDFDFDAWVDLVPRPGKKDKKVKGQIHLQWNVRFMKNFVVNPATEWPDLSLISIEPVPYLNYIEVMVRNQRDFDLDFKSVLMSIQFIYRVLFMILLCLLV